jgi:CxxC-x17-CxxC domain-containing protein
MKPRQPAKETAIGDRPKKAKPERPKFDVTCIECGTAAQVPFKPIDGRDVFCQPCYRARRGIVAPTTEPNLAISSDGSSDGAPAGAVSPSTAAEAPHESTDASASESATALTGTID